MLDATRIVAIRHGETAWNAEGRLQGQLDVPLNAVGRAQAARLAQALGDEGLQAVVSSDLGRAWHTAQALAGPLGLPLQAEPGLRERGFGALQGLRYDEIRERWPELAERWRRRDLEFAAPDGGESLPQFSARVLAAVERAAGAHAGGCIALVCHGGVLDCLYRAATRLALDAPRSWQLGNASINRLLHTPQGLSLVGWDDVAHLQDLGRDDDSA
ncbi:MAG: histidine phosphatase family protein [Burkholderiaceae bacterium]|nr:histidine phosphatase family protein [Burkholderiaceae bacterium]